MISEPSRQMILSYACMHVTETNISALSVSVNFVPALLRIIHIHNPRPRLTFCPGTIANAKELNVKKQGLINSPLIPCNKVESPFPTKCRWHWSNFFKPRVCRIIEGSRRHNYSSDAPNLHTLHGILEPGNHFVRTHGESEEALVFATLVISSFSQILGLHYSPIVSNRERVPIDQHLVPLLQKLPLADAQVLVLEAIVFEDVVWVDGDRLANTSPSQRGHIHHF
mmetsp:Transcript_11384/g.21686  ORF Transcript_11384/g.21686 Transcript_11384/m.21686 type:complete len:225 (+) Transcript_11384:3-677(+)